MRAYIFLIVIFATVCASWAGLLVGPPRPNPDYPNKCFVVARTYGRLLREAYSVGTHTPDGKCMKVFCKSDLSYVVHTCGNIISTEPGYHNEIDYSKPYPKCCYNLVKDKYN